MLTLPEALSDFRARAGYDENSVVTVTLRSARGETPMHWMCTLGDHLAIGLLVATGADIDAQDEAGNASIHEACASRQWTALSALIKSGANLSLVNRAGLTALGIATQQGFRPCIELLSGPCRTPEG